MNSQQVWRPIRVAIEIELLIFKDSIRNIERSVRAGHIAEDDAHRLRNKLACFYGERIESIVDERRPRWTP